MEFNTQRSSNKKLIYHMRGLLNSSSFSDVTLILPGGHTIKAHKNILSARCKKFKEMFITSRDTSATSLYDTGSVEIKCDDPISFAAMIEYLYTSEVNFAPLSVNNIVNLGYLASEFSLQELASFCRNSLVRSLGAATVCKVYSYAFECDDILRLCCLDFICQHFQEVEASGTLTILNVGQAGDVMRFLHSKASLASHRHRIFVSHFTQRSLSYSSSSLSSLSSISSASSICSLSSSTDGSSSPVFRSNPFAFNGCLWQFSFEPSETTINVNLFLHNYAYMATQLHFSLEFVVTFGENIKIVATHDFEKGSVYCFVIGLQTKSMKLKEDSLEIIVEITPPKKKI